MNLDEMIAVLEAARAGKVIQVKNYFGTWQDIEVPRWNFEDYEFRAKPEPREFWITCGIEHFVYGSLEAALNRGCKRDHLIRVREVLENGGGK